MKINEKIIRDLAERIELENELFKTLTPNQKKVVIAEDCLQRIEANQLVPLALMFLNSPSQFKKAEQSIQNQLNCPEMQIQCEGCAKGSLFLSFVGRVNGFNVDDITESFVINQIDSVEHHKLLEIFSARELAYIEFAFEGQQYLESELSNSEGWSEPIVFTDEEKIKAQKFYIDNGGQYSGEVGDKYFRTEDNDECQSENRDRLIAICHNIIANEGEFIL